MSASADGPAEAPPESAGVDALRPALRRLIDTVAATRVTELTVEHGGARVVLRREPPADATALPAAPRIEPAAVDGGGATIQAGLVGVFHRAARAGAPPMVDVGDTVAAGQPVGVIAAMELANEVTAPIAGTVRRVVAEEGQPVEYGQPLMVLDPLA